MPVNSKFDPDANEGDDGTGLAFAETQEWIKTALCYRCSGKGHLLSICKKTPPERKKAIYDMVKTGDFKTSSKGVVQVEAIKGSDESVAPSDENDVKKFVDFVGVQELNVGESDDEPNFEDDSFGFFGINFGKVGEILTPRINTKDNSKSIRVTLTDVKSGGNRRLTLDWWKLYLDSCASYHTFLVK